MQEILAATIDAMNSERPVAFCRLAATRGSTPQKAGAAMLVYANGELRGTLGGGCVEAEVRRRAIAILVGDGHPITNPSDRNEGVTVVRFQLDHDYGWDDGLICGGRMDVMIVAIADDQHREYFEALAERYQSDGGGIEAVAFRIDSTEEITHRAACCLVDSQCKCIASIPKRSSTEAIRLAATSASELPSSTMDPALVVRDVAERFSESGLPQRPQMVDGIAVLPIARRGRLFIIGGGHVGLAVAKLASEVDFDVTVVDDRIEYVTADRFPMAVERIACDFDEALPQLRCEGASALIVTRGHNHDQTALYHLVNQPLRYLGMIGSRRKVRLIFDNLLAEGITADALDRVRAPVGLNIGSQTVPEIAISIVAELIADRQGAQSCGIAPPLSS